MSRNGWITVGLGIMPADRYVMTYDLASSSSMYGTYTYSTPGNDSQIPKQCLKKQVRKKTHVQHILWYGVSSNLQETSRNLHIKHDAGKEMRIGVKPAVNGNTALGKDIIGTQCRMPLNLFPTLRTLD